MERRRAVAAAASRAVRARSLAAVARSRWCSRRRSRGPTTRSTSLSDARILDAMGAGLRLESVTTRVTGFDQFGHGYQAQGGPTPLSPGSERADGVRAAGASSSSRRASASRTAAGSPSTS